ncbi:MAG: 3,4-dihydroxy-2-butanone-4-phosphate synthase [Actinobacteria bacterium]|uniref:GTP cyclohydrolase II n=1 Tax=freshwater metagenome TaxID=449393 RepID=A0A6J6B2D7_9ZZZZ|nr:3,4-dihydroxy-2-butanone-4-phosphate synthase [Actinomycetota bacterium]
MSSSIAEALTRFSLGEFLIVVDDDDRENEGDLIMLASAATPEKTAFMVRHTTGILCVAITSQRARDLKLPYMVEANQDKRQTAFTVSVDLADGMTTGVSAIERTATIRALGSLDSLAGDFVRPGHIFPLIAHDDGLEARQGHTEAGVALAQLTHSTPAALLSEIVNDDGSMARGVSLTNFSKKFGIPIISIRDLRNYQEKNGEPSQPTRSYEFSWSPIRLENSEWNIATFPSLKHREQVVMKYGKPGTTPLVRFHSECFTGDVIGSLRCDCGDQLKSSIKKIEENGFGYIIYLRDHEGRGIGLTNKLEAYNLQNQGLDTVDANIELGFPVDSRNWNEAIAILHALHESSIKLLTNNPEKIAAVVNAGIECEQISLHSLVNEFNEKYLATKVNRLGHTGGNNVR